MPEPHQLPVPRHLYHGTCATLLDNVLSEGLLPRSANPSTWANQPSHPDFVYLTAAYPGYFAANAATAGSDLLIVELETSALDPLRLHPDEDAIAFRLVHDFGFEWEEAALEARLSVEDDQGDWPYSLETLGNCAHLGPISPAPISRYVVVDSRVRARLVGSMLDPVICPANFRIKGEFYRHLVGWTFGDSAELPQVAEAKRYLAAAPEMAECVEMWLQESRDRSGVTVVDRLK